MTQSEKETHIKNIFSSIAPYIDFLNRLFSFGIDMRWRKKLISTSSIKGGDRVLDICTGTGDLAFVISDTVGPSGSVDGIDFVEKMLEIAEKRKKSRKYNNVTFAVGDATALTFPDDSFDAVTVAFGIRNIPKTHTALAEVRRVLKQGGQFLCLELTQPKNRLIFPFYKFYTFKVMPFVAKLVSRTETPYNYLPQSIEKYYKPEEFKELLLECGFSDITVRPMNGGIVTAYSAISKK
jgi:demethylmenaquinone methyltransferase/2-methoxy-6-polyprenyl-1,4-benzoquinol methylase